MPRKKTEANGEPVPVDDPEPQPESEIARPAATIRYGYIKAVVWRNETDQGIRFNVTFARIYRLNGDGEWGQSTSFGARDLPLVEKCAAAALEYIRSQYDETPF